MITLACTNCKTVLTMDEAFAGGVCRCQHCGTIQTVPSNLKQGSKSGAPAGQAVGASKSLYQQTRAHTDAASGLESLGDVATSSGLGSRRLASPRSAPAPTGAGNSVDNAPAPPAAKNPLLVPLLIAVGVVVVLLIGLVIFLLIRSGSSAADTGAGGSDISGATEPPAAVAGPSFLGTPLKGSSVVYLIDRGNGTSEYFDALKGALVKSLHSLGPDRTFQVMLWNNGEDPVAYPTTGLLEANDNNIQHVEDALRDITASGASTISDQLTRAIVLKPDAIVIATGKVDLGDDEATALKKAGQSGGVPLYLFEIGSNELSGTFQPAAAASSGTFRTISGDQLKQLAQ